MPLAVTGASIVIVPAVPLLPIAATSPLIHAVSLVPSDQFRPVEVFQFPSPSVGAAGFAPPASHVSVCPNDGLANSPAATGANAMTRKFARLRLSLRMIHSPSL